MRELIFLSIAYELFGPHVLADPRLSLSCPLGFLLDPSFRGSHKKPNPVDLFILFYVGLLGSWTSSGPFPLSAHLRFYKRGRDPPTNPKRHLKKGLFSRLSDCSRKINKRDQQPPPPLQPPTPPSPLPSPHAYVLPPRSPPLSPPPLSAITQHRSRHLPLPYEPAQSRALALVPDHALTLPPTVTSPPPRAAPPPDCAYTPLGPRSTPAPGRALAHASSRTPLCDPVCAPRSPPTAARDRLLPLPTPTSSCTEDSLVPATSPNPALLYWSPVLRTNHFPRHDQLG